jgi:putative phosphoesterase
MRIGILSDIHDNLVNLDRALAHFRSAGVSELIFCGDFCSPFSAAKLASWEGKVHAVFGNNDGDRFTIRQKIQHHPEFHLYGEYGGDEEHLITIDGVRICITHYPFYAVALARTGWFDAVFTGHTHKAEKQRFSSCLLLNPGEVAGVFGPATVAVYDTQLRSSEIVELGDGGY